MNEWIFTALALPSYNPVPYTVCLAMAFSGPFHRLENPKRLAKPSSFLWAKTKADNEKQITVQGELWVRAG